MLVHAARLADDSSAHWNFAPVSPLKENVALAELTRTDGPAVTVGAPGGVVSMIQEYEVAGLVAVPLLSAPWTWKVCVPAGRLA